MGENLKIAFFVAEFPVLSETFIRRQIDNLNRRGHSVTVIAGIESTGGKNQLLGVSQKYSMKVIYRVRGSVFRRVLSVMRFSWSFVKTSGAISRLISFSGAIRRNGSQTLSDIANIFDGHLSPPHLGSYDAVIAHFGPAGVRAMRLVEAGLLSGPIATVFHGYDMSATALLNRYALSYQDLFRNTQLMLPISQLWRDQLIKWGAVDTKTRILHMGVDLSEIAMKDPTSPLHTPLRVISVARFTEKKGLRYAIEGIIACEGRIRYSIIGSGPLDDELRALASGADDDKEIIFLGSKSHEDVLLELDGSDVFLLPSVTSSDGDMEGIPVALMEAMAKGILVVATHHSGIPELIENNVSGFLVPERNSEAITVSIQNILAGAMSVETLRMNARHKITIDFNSDLLNDELEEICRDLAQTASSPRNCA